MAENGIVAPFDGVVTSLDYRLQTGAGNATMLEDINPGTGTSFFTSGSFTYLDGVTYFKASDGNTTGFHGDELWQTNGTRATTDMVGGLLGDIYPGINGSNPGNLTTVNNTLFFAAMGLGTGTELYKVDGPGSNAIPTADNMTWSQSITEDTPFNLIFNALPISVDDKGDGDLITVTLDLDNAAAGALSSVNGGDYNTGTGFWSVTGDMNAVNSALNGLTFTPTADWNGTVNITTHVQDSHVTGPVNGKITLTVLPVNDATSVNQVTVNLSEDPSAPVAVVLSGTPGPANEQGQILTYVLGDVTGIHGNLYSDPAGLTTALQTGATLVAGTAGQSPVTIYYKPDLNYNGPVSFSYSATDNGGTPIQGTDTPNTVTLNVAAVNTAPVNNNLPGAIVLTDEDAPVTFGGANAISISDVDLNYGSPTSLYSVSLDTSKAGVDTGTIHLNSTTLITGGANDTSAITLTGTVADINLALDGLQFIPFAQNFVYSGTDNAVLNIVTSDSGNIGTGNVLLASDAVHFTVSPDPDAPVNTVNAVNIPAGANPTLSLAGALVVHDGDVNDTLFVDITAGTGVLGLSWGPSTKLVQEYVFTGTETYLNALLSSPNGLKVKVPAGFSGPATVDVTTTDISGLSNTKTITITFDGPTSAAPELTTGAVGYGVYEDNSPTGAPPLGSPVDLSSCVTVSDPNGDPLFVDLTVSTGWSGLTVTPIGATVTGNGTATLHVEGSMFDVQNTLHTLQGTLIPDFNGNAIVNVTATDNNTPLVSSSFTIDIEAVNDNPVVTVSAPYSTAEDTGINITGVSVSDVDVDGTLAPNNTIKITLNAAHGAVSLNGTTNLAFSQGDGTADATMTFTGTLVDVNTALSSLAYTPNLNYNGADAVTVTANDLFHTGVGGGTDVANSVGVTVSAVDDAPTLSLPGLQNATLGGSPLVFSAGNLNQIQVSDLDAAEGNGIIEVSLSVANGTLTLAPGFTPALITVGADGSASMTLTGLQADINNALNGMQYLPNAGFVGADSLALNVNDLGQSGAGGPLSALGSVGINSAANVAPQLTIVNPPAFLEDAGTVNLGTALTVTDPDSPSVTVTVSAGPGFDLLGATKVNNATVTPDINNPDLLTIQGTVTDVNATLTTLKGHLTPNFNGTEHINVTVSDGIDSALGSVVASVTAVNDTPVLTVPGAQTGSFNTALPITGISVADVDLNGAAAPNDTISVHLDVAHGTLSLANTAGLTFDAGHTNGAGSVWVTGNLVDVGNALATVTYTPTTNYKGPDTLSVAANDLGHTGTGGPLAASGSVQIGVNGPPPTITTVNKGPFAEDAGTLNLARAVVVADPDSPTLTLNLTASAGYDQLNAVASGAAIVTGAHSTSLSVQGSVADINATMASLTGHTALNFNGTATINATVSDGTSSANSSVLATVTAVNDAPVTTIPASQLAIQGTPLVFSAANGNAIVLSDVDAGTGQMRFRMDVTHGT